MNRVMAIAGREMRSSLSSPLAYVFIALFVLVAMVLFFFKEAFFATDQATTRGFFRWVPALLVFVGPALTMKLWTDERKLGTYELLATLPLKPSEMVLGKFLGALGLLVLALLFTLGLPIVVEMYGDLDWGPVFGGYVGALLIGASYLAIGLVCSALVQDQIVALFLGVAACALTLLPGAAFWESFLPPLANALRPWGFWTRFDAIERGVIDIGDLLFYASATAFFLFVNVVLIRWRRYQ